MKDKILLFTDGASKGNPGCGGWGAVIVKPDGQVREIGASNAAATNNQMELTAVIEALRATLDTKGGLVVATDSSYVVQGIQKWIIRWKANNWRTVSGQAVSNQALWQELDSLVERRKNLGSVEWMHVYGHVGIPGNEKADRIADAFAKQGQPSLFNGSLEDYDIDPYELNVTAQNLEKKKRSKKTAFSYLSLVNGAFRRHKTWKECEDCVKGRPGAKFKKALSEQEELAIMKQWGVDNSNRVGR